MGENAPKSFAKFQELKYNSGDGWAYTKQFASYKRRVPEATKEDYEKYKELKAAGVQGIIRVPAMPIDTSMLVFNDKHAAGHGCTEEQAREYVSSAVCSITKKRWDGTSENFFSANGAAYINLETMKIKTSFPREEYRRDALIIMEVFKC